MFDKINLRSGKITYNEFHIQLNEPLESQIFELEEDLLQIKFGNKYCIDVGWYPSLNPQGHLVIYVIENSDWSHPKLKKTVAAKDIQLFPKILEEIIQFVDELRKNEF